MSCLHRFWRISNFFSEQDFQFCLYHVKVFLKTWVWIASSIFWSDKFKFWTRAMQMRSMMYNTDRATIINYVDSSELHLWSTPTPGGRLGCWCQWIWQKNEWMEIKTAAWKNRDFLHGNHFFVDLTAKFINLA